jgi:aminopeptidase N
VSLRTAGVWKSLSNTSHYYPVPLDHPALFDYYGDVYGAGPMTLFRQLEVLSSRDAVIAALKSVLGTPRSLSVDQLLAALTAKTGLDLTQYATDWIKGNTVPKWPHIKTTFTAGSGATSTLLVHMTSGKGGCKFHVELDGANAGETQLVAVDTFHTSGDQTLTVPTPAFTVATTTLDPLNECLVYQDTSTVAPAHVRKPWLSERAQ